MSDRPLRIGFLTYGLDRPLSGISRVAMELGAALQRSQECEVVFLTPYRKGPFADDAGASSLRLVGCEKLPWDDRRVARDVLASLGYTGGHAGTGYTSTDATRGA